MRILILILAVLLAPIAASASDVSRCYTIANPDARNYCRAKAAGDRAICATIASHDLRAACQAEVG